MFVYSQSGSLEQPNVRLHWVWIIKDMDSCKFYLVVLIQFDPCTQCLIIPSGCISEETYASLLDLQALMFAVKASFQ